jgi:hypothetical protein
MRYFFLAGMRENPVKEKNGSQSRMRLEGKNGSHRAYMSRGA